MSKELRIMQSITERLLAINGTGTFNSNVELRVYRGRLSFDDADTYPLLTISDDRTTNETAEASIYDKARVLKRVTIHGIVDVSDINNPNDDAYLLVADIKKAIFSGDERLGGDAIMVTYIESSVAAREESITKVGLTVGITVLYAENLLTS